MGQKEKIYDLLKKLYIEKKQGVTAEEIAEIIGINRSNISSYLNKLNADGRLRKIKSRPVYFIPSEEDNDINKNNEKNKDIFTTLIGKTHSLKEVVEKAKAAMLYPPYGLHTIIYGETGVGKSMLAKYMYDYSVSKCIRKDNSPFITFNCADYANNPQLLMANIFGVEKGAYTGAESSRIGLLEAANGGILFLDEIHRLPPEGQEMLFTFIDKGVFRKMGNTTREIKSQVLIIAATTENFQSSLLDTFNRRIPMKIEIPPLRKRSFVERIELIKNFFRAEATRINVPIKVHSQIINSFLLYECKNNVGQLQSDIKLAVANAYLNYVTNKEKYLDIVLGHFNSNMNDLKDNYREKYNELKSLTVKNLDYYIFYPSSQEKAFTIKESKNNFSKINIVEKQIKEEFFIEKLFIDEKFIRVCNEIKNIIMDDLNINFNESQFISLSIYVKNIIDGKEKAINLDVNKIRQENKNKFKTALRIINIIESEYNICVSLEEVAYITLFIIDDKENEDNNIDLNVNIIVAMHGDNTATSMVRTVNKILGNNDNLYAFDMNLDKSYNEIVEDFENLINCLEKEKDIVFFTDMGSLNSFDKMITKFTRADVRTIPMVTTLLVIEAVQKANIGLTSLEIYNSILYIQNYSRSYKEGLFKDITNNIIILGYKNDEDIDFKIRDILKKKLLSYIEDIEIMYLPYKDRRDLILSIKKIMDNNNVIALINEFDVCLKDVDYIQKGDISKEETIETLKNLIKISNGYYDIAESLKVSLKYVNYVRVFNDIKFIINDTFKKLKVKKTYDKIIGLAMHIAFMVDELVGKIREFESEDRIIVDDKIMIVKKNINLLEENYNIKVSNIECSKIYEMIVGEN
ncbi:Transcriptional regulator containing an AAA-type ATPase domain and a DNA-binding domain [Clostridium cavendishii DSM 21758]|uniref:Transcriptional regulator containing an AAA-type ATPase domain and a DNA-binding domain n=1 Tax=Clostridium cavendishii DSM 21758 TaxID=1121302 RepID=A0A1M6QEL5_9CLOT|nr:sigma-54-dependent transcriptional regulator [Clostridium cavendishii]SHK18754.1 Transcriptional regulator containing an AAA-type ATPase domain and a DNA-binding domain [Clostridium cavendishii DSM 21758]